MEFRNLEDPATEAFLRGVIASGRTVPFIGTGFTRGERARAKLVPDGREWMAIMRQQIGASSAPFKPTKEQLDKYDFQKLSDVYFRDDIVGLDQIKSTLDGCFSGVRIATSSKLSFLNIPWPYIYTLNIDDGIENAIDGVKVVPYEPFAKSSVRRYVYKIHGDVFTALKAVSRDALKLVFGKGDYIRSLNKNRPLIDELKADLSESNLLFIGCSLTDEIDVLYALSEHEEVSGAAGSRRIYITSSSPEGDYDIVSKLRDYKITDVIICNYDDFYLKASELANETLANSSPAKEFEFKLASEKFSVTQYLQYFLQSNWSGGDSSHLSIVRDADRLIMDKVEENTVVVLTGTRFSGRTTALYRALRSFKSKKSYLVTSSSAVSDGELSHILNLKDSFIVFDSESLNFSQIYTVCRSVEKLESYNSKILLVIDKNNLFATEVLPENSVVTLSSRFSANELELINEILGTVGVARLAKSGTILDHIYQVADSSVVKSLLKAEASLKEKIDNRVRYVGGNISRSEFGLLYILAVKQKVLSVIYRSILQKSGYATTAEDYISTVIQVWGPFIERSNTDRSTMAASHSSFALTSNSQVWLFYALRSLVSVMGVDKSASLIVDTVSAVKSHKEYYDLVMFDVLNSVFSAGSNGRSHNRALIGETYKELARILSGEPNYWLQRAKSIYHDHSANSADTVLAAIEHAEKAINETEKTVTINAKLTRANLYGLLCYIENYQNSTHYVAAINCYHEAFDDYHMNKDYLDELIQRNRGRKGYLIGLLSSNPGSDVEVLKIRDKVAHLRQIVGLIN
ncbi:SIR2 family protein [Pseudomonas sp. NPDC077408]